jgi:hypothetical protein
MIYNSQPMGEMDYATYRACKQHLKDILRTETDEKGVPLYYDRLITETFPSLDIQFPNESSSCVKLSLLFRLQKSMHDINKIVLMAQRIERFTREEAAYWLSKTLYDTEEHNRWAVKGLRIVLAG